jgi:hypothetical protein
VLRFHYRNTILLIFLCIILNMRSRCFITPKNLGFVEAVLDLLEKHGVTETMIRNHTPGFVELEVLGWNLLSIESQVLILDELSKMNVQFLISRKC